MLHALIRVFVVAVFGCLGAATGYVIGGRDAAFPTGLVVAMVVILICGQNRMGGGK